jgi:hypothetical protein
VHDSIRSSSIIESDTDGSASKTFRIFVSSTFDDLKEERNALQQYVFLVCGSFVCSMVAAFRRLTCAGM